MRKSLIGFFLVVLSWSLMAQVRTGSIYGKVVDKEGNPLPGVTVTLTGSLTAPVSIVTPSEGTFRFLSLAASKEYSLKASLQGFDTAIRENIVVVVGSNAEVNIMMEMGKLENEVVVTAKTAVVDRKKTSVGQVATQEVLQELPTGRSPFAVIHGAPGILTNKEDVGGSEAGSQYPIGTRGMIDQRNDSWAMDGVVITDPSATGTSPGYYDYDAFEQMSVVTGGADITSMTGGVAINMVTKRGGNKVTFGGRFYLTSDTFQASNLTPQLTSAGVGINKIINIKDYGFNLGMPIIKDKLWFWGSYGILDSHTINIYSNPDNTLLTNIAAKINAQIVPQNRFEAFVHMGNKQKQGIQSGPSLPAGMIQQSIYHWGSPLFKIQDEQIFGDNFLLSFKMSSMYGGFTYVPVIDQNHQNMAIWDVTNQNWQGSSWNYVTKRPQRSAVINGQYFTDKFLNVSQEFKFGVEIADRRTSDEGDYTYNGNVITRINYNVPTVALPGETQPGLYPGIASVEPFRANYSNTRVRAFSIYGNDTITFKRFTLLVGLRYDQQTPSVAPTTFPSVDRNSPVWQNYFSPAAADAINSILPSVSIGQIKATASDGSRYAWRVPSPRIGLTWDVTGDGKTIAKLSGAIYGEYMGTGLAGNWKRGGTTGWMHFWWLDNNHNSKVDLNELYWNNFSVAPTYQLYRAFNDNGAFVGNLNDAAGLLYGAYDPLNPNQTTDPYTLVDKDAGASRTSEVMLSLEREILSNFGVSLVGTFRRYNNFNWALPYYPESGQIESPGWYVSAGKPPANIPGMGSTLSAGDHDWYYLDPQYGYTPYTFLKPRRDYRVDFMGIDVIFDKRLSDKWMFNGSVSWLHQADHFGPLGINNDTNLWALQGQPDIGQNLNPRWMVKASGLYQLPYHVNCSFTFSARDGRIVQQTFKIVDYDLPNPLSNSATLLMTPYGTQHLKPLVNLCLRVEKEVKIAAGSIYLMADVFNVFNSGVVHNQAPALHGTYTIPNDIFSINPNDSAPLNILNPLVARFGVRFVF